MHLPLLFVNRTPAYVYRIFKYSESTRQLNMYSQPIIPRASIHMDRVYRTSRVPQCCTTCIMHIHMKSKVLILDSVTYMVTTFIHTYLRSPSTSIL